MKIIRAWDDPVLADPRKLTTEQLVLLRSDLQWRWFVCLAAESGSYEDRIEAEPTANALTDADIEICRRAAGGDDLALTALDAFDKVNTTFYFHEVGR